MNSSGRNFFEYEDKNQSNTESSNTQDDSKEQDDKNIESLFEPQNSPNQSSDDDLMSLFANSGMLQENNPDLFNSPEMMSVEETELFNNPEIVGETKEIDLFNSPEIMSMGEETDLFNSPEMMSTGDEISEIDLFNSPEIMSMSEETEFFNPPVIGGEASEMDLFNSPEMMSMGENEDLLATPEMMSMDEQTSEMDLFNSPEMMSMGEQAELFNSPEMMSMGENEDLLATPETMSMGEQTNEMDLLATPDLTAQNDDINQFTEVMAIDSELDSSQQPEIGEETNDTNLGLGLGAAAIAAAASIPLLEERLIVDINKQKIGEVVVRKEVETEMVQVPIRREKLIVEQVGAETIQLAEIDLGQSDLQGVSLATEQTNTADRAIATINELIVTGEFTSAKIASLLLNAIALERKQGCKKIKIQIVVDDEERQQTYQEWVNRCSIKPSQN